MYAGPVQDLIEELGRLPGIGPKSAQRIAFHLLRVSEREAGRLAS
ncbi:MAG: recombination protein RecR, partial [Actinobacteria bacterium]|nr:recombination protein RecR [Actinomycetota bacterium]